MAHFSPAARGVVGRHRNGEMNGLEREWFNALELRRHAGEFTHVYFEQMTFKIGPDLRYTPDFMVMTADGSIVFYEAKGFFRDDSRVKIVAAAEMFPMFVFYLVRKERGMWKIEEI